MSDFKFNFGESDDDGKGKERDSEEDLSDTGPEAMEVPWTSAHSQPPLQAMKTVQHRFGSHVVETITTASVEDHLLQQSPGGSVAQAIEGNTDIIAGHYEGGLKVWECCLDLCQYLVDRQDTADSGVSGLRVLELGCGAGLPAMVCCTLGARATTFQDFNREVLEWYTMRNVELNGIKPETCTFFSGDWVSFASLAEAKQYKYDLILTAETIYNVSSYPKLLKVFSSLLAKEGEVLVAAKNDYYGVGGGVASFVQFVQQTSPQFAVQTVKHIDAGIPRKILKLTRT